MKRTQHKDPTKKPTQEELLQRLRELDEKQMRSAVGGCDPGDKCRAICC